MQKNIFPSESKPKLRLLPLHCNATNSYALCATYLSKLQHRRSKTNIIYFHMKIRTYDF